MDLIAKIFETKRDIQLLHFSERLHIPPTSETSTLLTIWSFNEKGDSCGISVTELASLLCVSVPTVSRCLQKLSAKGYIVKTSNQKDRRGTYVTLTPEGEAICKKARKNISGFLERVLAHIDPAELEQFFHTMDKILDAVRTELSGCQK